MSPRTTQLLDRCIDDALSGGRYDFRMGRKLAPSLEAAGLSVVRTFDLHDRELAFDGPADPDVIVAWRERFARMHVLRNVCADEFPSVEREFLDALARPDHRCLGRVVACVAERPVPVS